jgi:hypothetical protein
MYPYIVLMKKNDIHTAELIKCIKSAWAAITTEEINNLIDSLPCQIEACIRIRRWYTKYWRAESELSIDIQNTIIDHKLKDISIIEVITIKLIEVVGGGAFVDFWPLILQFEPLSSAPPIARSAISSGLLSDWSDDGMPTSPFLTPCDISHVWLEYMLGNFRYYWIILTAMTFWRFEPLAVWWFHMLLLRQFAHRIMTLKTMMVHFRSSEA